MAIVRRSNSSGNYIGWQHYDVNHEAGKYNETSRQLELEGLSEKGLRTGFQHPNCLKFGKAQPTRVGLAPLSSKRTKAITEIINQSS